MKFCKYCGSQREDAVTMCPKCGRDLSSSSKSSSGKTPEKIVAENNSKNSAKKIGIFAVVGVLAIVGIIVLFGNVGKCDYCSNKAVAGYDYCYNHKCAVSTCESSASVYSNYCYSHSLLYDEDATTNTKYVPSYQLKISGVTLYSSGNYTYAEGSITNKSDETVSYIKIKGSFENAYGTVVDTDWTYAVGSEGLAPGESCKWKLSVEKDRSIEDCEITILDYDY